MLALIQHYGVSPMLWSCLAGGKIFNSSSDQAQRIRDALKFVADQLSLVDLEPVLYAWVLTLPCKPFPLLGSGNIERIKQAIKADQLNLSREHWYYIWQAAVGHPVP